MKSASKTIPKVSSTAWNTISDFELPSFENTFKTDSMYVLLCVILFKNLKRHNEEFFDILKSTGRLMTYS